MVEGMLCSRTPQVTERSSWQTCPSWHQSGSRKCPACGRCSVLTVCIMPCYKTYITNKQVEDFLNTKWNISWNALRFILSDRIERHRASPAPFKMAPLTHTPPQTQAGSKLAQRALLPEYQLLPFPFVK